jgi:hypothetical protein
LVSDEPTSPRQSAQILYASEEDMREAIENFRQYMVILEEWNAREKRETVCNGPSS